MTVYVRTEVGQQAAYSAESALPRKLKSILKVIDGKTSLDVFQQSLQSFGDVRAIFHSLDMAGLITVQGFAPQPITGGAEIMKSESGRFARPNPLSEWQKGSGQYIQSVLPSAPPLGLRAEDGLTNSFARGASGSSAQKKAEALKAALDDMGHFILTHLPDQSFGILKELDDINSLELLGVTLGGYEQMVSQLGTVATDHLHRLKQILRDNL